ncbi:TPA: hypothetical protein LVL24_002270 [Klebsiella oxytoca]|uniref:hypothetical protein n=1 Tax=Klebsiella oxytoca TaxID=571 RepID=UPI001918E141|nr:hypothetical protein [Klebsiella oxytoca]HBM2940169.1 hypothetical protein [Klebsiella oxytoca]
MTNSTIARERLEELAAGQSGFNLRIATHEESQELARIALAAMDSEPVVYASEETLAYAAHGELLLRVLSQPAGDAIIPLYRHAQQPVVPDDSDPRDAFEAVFPMPKYAERCGNGYCVTAYSAWSANDFKHKWEGWNACRAAMLNHPSSIQPNTDAAPGTEIKHPSTNSPVIPEGYVMVPKEATLDMLKAGAKQEMKGEAFQYVWQAMLAAAPQEVK